MRIQRHESIANVVRIEQDEQGPRVVLFSGVHGDEVSGVHAVDKIFFDLFTGARTLLRGTLTLVRANELALAAGCRYVRHNLNRMFRYDYGAEIDRTSYEFERAQQLKGILQGCDYFLDLHSAPTAQEPFIIVEQEHAAFYSTLGVNRLITGWSKFSGGTIGGDAENYGNAHGAKSATLEAGGHLDMRSNEVAYRTILRLLSRLGMLAGVLRPAMQVVEAIEMYAVVTKDSDDFCYAKPAENFRFVKKGEAVAFQGGRSLDAPEDTFLLMPMKPEATKIGEEVCYLGRRIGGAVRA